MIARHLLEKERWGGAGADLHSWFILCVRSDM